MIYRIEFSKDVQKVIKKWKKSNLPLFKKLEKLIPELSEHPRTGNLVSIIELEGHYNDK